MNWKERAACRGVGVDLFFARRTSPEGREAVTYCEACPVRDECLDDCLATEKIRLGIRGGLGPYERDDYVRGRRDPG